MRTLNLSGFNTGDNLNLSVSQNAITAGPVNIPAWGGAIPSSDITITVNRTSQMVAPDSVRLSVDLSQADFDTTGPVGDEIYDARMHDLIYLWDFDDVASGHWAAPVNVLLAWKNRNTAKGPWVAHMYTRPGTYNPSVLVIEPSSGKIATASISITVADPDVIYAGTNTICVNPIGDNDFKDAPSGATQVNLEFLGDAIPEWIGSLGGGSKRWLFKRGGSFNQTLNINAAAPGLYFGAYGSGTKPIINAVPKDDAKKGIVYCHGAYGVAIAPVAPDLRFSGLRFQGTMDATSEWANQWNPDITNGIILQGNTDLIFSDCVFDGLHGASCALQPGAPENQANYHLDDCILTNFGGQYPFFYSKTTNPLSSFVATGCRFSQVPDAVDTDATKSAGSRSPIRSEWAKSNHVRGCDFYHTDSTQPALKLISTPEGDGAVVNVHSTSFEHGAVAMTITGNSNTNGKKGVNRSTAQNVIIDGVVFVAAFCGETALSTSSTGLTLRNWLVIFPAVAKFPTALIAQRSFFKFYETTFYPYDPVIVGAAPVRVYNCTLVTERNSAQNNGHVPALIDSSSANSNFTNIEEHNNILHMPNNSIPVATFAPLAMDILWTPRNPGRRDPDTFVLDTAYAAPLDAVKSYRPLPGSSALGAALSGNVSYMDILMQERPEPPSKGAWEAN